MAISSLAQKTAADGESLSANAELVRKAGISQASLSNPVGVCASISRGADEPCSNDSRDLSSICELALWWANSRSAIASASISRNEKDESEGWKMNSSLMTLGFLFLSSQRKFRAR